MSTTAGIQALLAPNSTENLINIIRESPAGANTAYYATGGLTAKGKARWTVVDPAQSDATNAAAITAKLLL